MFYKISKKFIILANILFCFVIVACGVKNDVFGETLSLEKTILNEVEFENSDKVKIEEDENGFKITGEIEGLSDAQISAFGDEDVTHVVVLKFMFDKERTIDSFEIKGNLTKVYSTDENVENYAGKLSDLLDNESSEDAFCYLILSANTKEYVLISKYTDGVESVIKLKIEANLVSAKAE